MSKKGNVYFMDSLAGVITEDENGFNFKYDEEYLRKKNSKPISLTLPLREAAYNSKTMIPFFDGLIPEGWLLNIAQDNWKINPKDRMSSLLTFCHDCIGAVSVIEVAP